MTPAALLKARAKRAAAALDRAFALCPKGMEGVALALAMHDAGTLSAAQALQMVRGVMRLPEPIVPGAPELAQDMATLYRARHPGTASA